MIAHAASIEQSSGSSWLQRIRADLRSPPNPVPWLLLLPVLCVLLPLLLQELLTLLLLLQELPPILRIGSSGE